MKNQDYQGKEKQIAGQNTNFNQRNQGVPKQQNENRNVNHAQSRNDQPKENPRRENFNRDNQQRDNTVRDNAARSGFRDNSFRTPNNYSQNNQNSSRPNIRFKADESAEDITTDIIRIEKEIELEIKEIKSMRLGM